jgi:uncharacterized YigZ family protein
MTADTMVTLLTSNHLEEEIKKSRFIARVSRAQTPEEALAFLASVRDPKATHNCWAYRMGELYRFSDDGEPGGTAGRPILAAIDSQGLDEVMAVVTRYYGGIKLGAGGLARAYGNTVAECLRVAERLELRPIVTVTLSAPFELTGPLYQLLDKMPLQRLGENYTSEGLVLTVRMEESAYQHFCDSLRDATRAQVVPQVAAMGRGPAIEVAE